MFIRNQTGYPWEFDLEYVLEALFSPSWEAYYCNLMGA